MIRTPTSVIKRNGKRINYLDFITSCENNDCCKALKCIKSRINMKGIYEIIDAVPMLTKVRKLFLKKVIKARNEIIINHSCIWLHALPFLKIIADSIDPVSGSKKTDFDHDFKSWSYFFLCDKTPDF